MLVFYIYNIEVKFSNLFRLYLVQEVMFGWRCAKREGNNLILKPIQNVSG